MNCHFRVARRLVSFALVSLSLLQVPCALATQSVSGKVTHNLHVPGSAEKNQTFSVSWTPKPEFSGYSFPFVKLSIQKPGQSWDWEDLYGSGQNITPDITGQWCFKVRGYSNGQFGNFTSPHCMNVTEPSVAGQQTHYISPVGGGKVNQSLNVAWNVYPQYSHLNFNWAKLAVRNPMGTTEYKEPLNGSYNFVPDMPGNWCFRVRAYLVNHFGSFSNEVCTNVSDTVVGKVIHSLSVPSTIDQGQTLNISWSKLPAFANLNVNWARLARINPHGALHEGKYIETSASSYGFSPNITGNWCFRVRAYVDGELSDFTANHCTNVIAPPAPVTGSAYLMLDAGVSLDKWLHNNERLAWDVAGINNVNHYKVLINHGGIVNSYTLQASGNQVDFTLNELGHQYSTNQNATVSLQGCNSANACVTVSSAHELTLVNTQNLAYFIGEPKHINQFSAEMPYAVDSDDTFLKNKRWNYSSNNKTTYNIELKDVFQSYLYQYDLASDTLNTNKPLFEAFSFTNQRFKVFADGYQVKCNEMQETFTSGSIKQLKGDLTECVRNYFDVVFGSKNSVDVAQREYFSNEHKPFLEVLQESIAVNHQGYVGFYLVIPSGLATGEVNLERRKLFVDEAIEQYAIFQANFPGSKVRLAGFYQMKESSSADTEDVSVIKNVRDHIKGFSQELEFNSSSYNILSGYVGAGPFEEYCDNNKFFQHCTSRFTAVHHKAFAEAFDDVSIQPNATMFRFHNRRNSYKVNGKTESDPNHTIGVDIEMLHWMNEGLFRPLAEGLQSSPANTKFSVHFEYAPHRVNGSNKANYGFTALNGEGVYGDISRYADYIMKELPAVYRNGSRPILYDDAGGLFYCHVKQATSGATQCRDHQTAGAIVGSKVDVRSMYQFIDATRGIVSYSGSNNILPSEPVLQVDTSRSVDIAITDSSKRNLTFQSLVRARLNDSTLHSATGSSTCSKVPEVTLRFYNAGGTLLSTSKVGTSYFQTPLQCRNFKQVFLDSSAALSDRSDVTINMDDDQWTVLKRENIYVPPHTARVNFTFDGVGDSATVETLLFSRSEYKLH